MTKKILKLRKQTGLGLMECKKALRATDGDLELAAAYLRFDGKAVHIKNGSYEEWVMESARKYVANNPTIPQEGV
jgi:translation elongation factor EF-Ts